MGDIPGFSPPHQGVRRLDLEKRKYLLQIRFYDGAGHADREVDASDFGAVSEGVTTCAGDLPGLKPSLPQITDRPSTRPWPEINP